MSIEAARNALARAGIDPLNLRAVWVGSESHPYAVKPSGTIVAEAIGAPETYPGWGLGVCLQGWDRSAGRSDGACRFTKWEITPWRSAWIPPRANPGDALEYTAASGGGMLLSIGPAEESLAVIDAHYSVVTDTPDFWRRAHQIYPEHGQRFTGEPAYFYHVASGASRLMDAMGMKPEDFKFAVFHQPNEKFPSRVAKQLGFKPEQIKTGLLLSPMIGNTYAGAALVGLTAVLDVAEPGRQNTCHIVWVRGRFGRLCPDGHGRVTGAP